jgi:hypothetical protein
MLHDEAQALGCWVITGFHASSPKYVNLGCDPLLEVPSITEYPEFPKVQISPLFAMRYKVEKL